ncbi:MAG: SPASM domain-containing protein [Bacteroidales bacterium]|jgi:radical SAM protein with 4Fe4S-binding SPASM domain|nr:SPASM domain-containing protein [Bacteroidales bacterium]
MENLLVKPVNAVMAGYSYMQSLISGSAAVYGMPLAAGIELTNYCNLNCPECNSGSGIMTRDRGYLSIDLFEKIVAELGPFMYNLNLYFQGESMMHPLFFSILEKCGDIRTTLSTNGHFLSPENAEKVVRSRLHTLIVSLDGMDQSTYSSYRVNGDFRTVIEGIRNISDSKKKNPSRLKLVIQFLVNRNNEHQVEAAKRFAAEMNSSLQLKSMQIINKDSHLSWLPSSGKFRRYTRSGTEYAIKSRLPDRCARLWFNPVITWDGKVVPCCFDKNADHVMGDINQESFRNIWNGGKYRQFRKSILTGRRMIDICRNCTSGLKQ